MTNATERVVVGAAEKKAKSARWVNLVIAAAPLLLLLYFLLLEQNGFHYLDTEDHENGIESPDASFAVPLRK